MSTIYTQNFDGVTPPALPSGITASSGFVTAANHAGSSPNSLQWPTSAAVGTITTTASDGNGGNAQATVSVQFGSTAGNQEAFVCVRMSGATTYYAASIQVGSSDSAKGLTIFKNVSNTFTVIGATIGVGAFTTGIFYRLQIQCSGSNQFASVQRLDNSQWLNSSGSWQSAQTIALSASDSGLSTTSNPAGLVVYNGNNGTIYFDDFLFETYSAPALTAPSLSIASATMGSVSLTCGTSGGGAGPYTYYLHRSTTAAFTPSGTAVGSGTCIAVNPSATFVDSGLVYGRLYYYKLIVVDSVSSTATSSQIAASPRASALVLGGIGDSIMAGNGLSAGQDPLTQMGLILAKMLKLQSVSITNRAIAGTKTADWLPGTSNLTNAKAAFASAGVTHIVIMLGANDAATTNHVSASVYVTNLTSIVSNLVSAGYKVILCYPTYIPAGANGGATDETAVNLAQQYRPLIDALINQTTVLRGDVLSPLYFADNLGEYQSDLTHPTATGAVSLATMWAVAVCGELGVVPLGAGSRARFGN